jgi:hypothetical protein
LVAGCSGKLLEYHSFSFSIIFAGSQMPKYM